MTRKHNPASKQKSRAKYTCPAELDDLIQEANLIPLGTQTPVYAVEVRRELERLRKETDEPSPELSAFAFLQSLIAHLPKEFLEHLDHLAQIQSSPWGQHIDSTSIGYRQAYVQEYVGFCERRDSMVWLVQRLETERNQMRDAAARLGLEKPLTFEQYASMDWDAFPIIIKTALVRDASHRLKITGLAALIGTFDDSRLRRCVVCTNIFWAVRHDSEACRNCANKWRIRLSRTLTPEQKAERKAKQEANRRTKKELPNIGRKHK